MLIQSQRELVPCLENNEFYKKKKKKKNIILCSGC